MYTDHKNGFIMWAEMYVTIHLVGATEFKKALRQEGEACAGVAGLRGATCTSNFN